MTSGRPPPIGHELVELGLVLGFAQSRQEFLEFALLVFEPAQRLGAIFVEGAVAGRRGGDQKPPPPCIWVRTRSIFSCMRVILLCQRSMP